MNWTDEQRQAITAEGNLIVSAAAGAGKTAVLTERIVSRVASGVPVEQLLVLTFTRAAAAEMKGRIAKRLDELAEAADSAERSRYFRKQARNVDGAYVSTIHAFCSRVLRRHYHAVGLPARTRTADEMESAALIETVRDELLTALAAEENEDYHALLSAFGKEDLAWDAVLSVYRFTRAEPDPEAWLSRAAAAYESDRAIEEILTDAVGFSRREIELMTQPLEAARDALPPDWDKVISILTEELAQYRALTLHTRYRDYRAALYEMNYAVMRFPKIATDEEKKPAKSARQAGKDLIKEQQKRFAREEEQARAVLVRSGEAVRALVAITRRFERAYTEAKRAANVTDYDDLEHLALEALKKESIAAEYRARFRWIAVDEYQDSNRVQEEILSRICRGDNLFFVGDVKQSIYRFRQAEPTLFLEKLSAFSGESGTRIDLSSNFRSSEGVLDAVNETFGAILNMTSGDIDYDERAKLACGAPQPAGGAELHLIRRERAESDEEQEDALEDAADIEVEARFIAERIQTMMKQETYQAAIGRETRAYRYADFAVLLRAGTNAQIVSQTLSQQGVPCYTQSGGGYFDAIEVQVLKNLLSVIDNRRQDVPLLSVLCSSIGSFRYEELANMRAAHREGAFHEAFFAFAESGKGQLAARAQAFLAKLERYRTESRLLSIEALIGMLLDETGFYEEMGAGYGGAQRQANLNALLDKAHTFESSGGRGVWNFLRHIDLARNNVSVGAAQTVTADVVRILTVHKSKGLEFPVVFVAGLGKPFNRKDQSASLQLHARYGMALRLIDAENNRRVKRDTIAREILSKRAWREELAEEMRVLYVAMTRAKRKLVLTCCMAKPEEKLSDMPEKPFAWQILRCSNFAQWLLLGPHRALKVVLHERERYLAGAAPEASAELPPFDPAVLAAIESRLNWSYAHAESVLLNAKAAVSSIGREEDGEPAFQTPAFLGGETKAAFAGTATHTAMQHLPLKDALDAAAAEAYLQSLVEAGRMTPEQADAADADAIAWFTKDALCLRMSRAARLERELPFSYPVDPMRLYGVDADEKVLLQGVIDACFVEDGAWTIVDYKTDRMRPGVDAAAAAERHAVQLGLYALALEAMTGIPVKERLVVLLSYRAVVALLPGA